MNDLAGGTLFPQHGATRWQALRQQALGDGLIDISILWRNERERAEPLQALMAAFEVKARSAIERLEDESESLDRAVLDIGQVAVGCALGYLDYRFADLSWRTLAPRLAFWFARVSERPSFRATVPIDG